MNIWALSPNYWKCSFANFLPRLFVCAKEEFSMKTILISAALAFSCADLAAAAPYVLPTPQPGALTVYDMQPMWGVSGVYTFSGKHELPDVYGARLHFDLYTDGYEFARHSFNMNATPQWGRERRGGYRESLFLCPFTAGYDLNMELNDSFFLYLGGKAGYALSHASVKRCRCTRSDTDGGFSYSVGAGLRYQASESVMLRAGYEFGRSYIGSGNGKLHYTGHSVLFGISRLF